MSRALAGSCTVPLGAYAQVKNNHITITGFVASVDGKEMVKEEVTGSMEHPEQLGQQLAEKLIALGANRILAALDTL